MATPSTATWNYALSLLLTPSLIQTLSGSNVGGMRNVVHFEVAPRATSQGQPVTSKAAKLDV